MARERDGVLAAARWGLLAWEDDGTPRLAPHAFWSDGAGLWLALPVDGAEVRGLRRAPSCSVWVPPVDGAGPGVAVSGRARVFGTDDPLALILHSPVLSTAALALAARSPGLVLEQARQAASFPPRLPRNRSIARITLERIRGVEPPAPLAGMAPPLPPVVPADVRRALGGTHSVAVAVVGDDGVAVSPASLQSGFRLAADAALPAEGRAAVGLVPESGDEPLPESGVVLEGALQPDACLAVDHVRWWIRGREGSGAVADRTGRLVLPD